MNHLITSPVKRFFSIGCSFTNYFWTTWPEILAEDLSIENFYNLGRCAAGNEFMFNRLMQIDQVYDLNENDLVIICWTNICREDRFLGKWITPGNIYSQKEYNKKFVKKYYSNPNLVLLHDFAFIKASRSLLEHKKVQWHFLQMLPIFNFGDQWDQNEKLINDHDFQYLINVEKEFLQPSFYEILWDNDIANKLSKCLDGHPSPLEHLEYLQKTFLHDWKQSTIDNVLLLENEHCNNFKNIHSWVDINNYNFNHLKNSLPHKIF